MQSLSGRIEHAEVRVTEWLIRYSIVLLRIGLGVVFFWFGVLKFFPVASPAQELALNTMEVLTFGMIPTGMALILLATLECAIGIGLITGKFLRLTLALLVFQMLGAWFAGPRITPDTDARTENVLAAKEAPTTTGVRRDQFPQTRRSR